jgi:hypothetical protein
MDLKNKMTAKRLRGDSENIQNAFFLLLEEHILIVNFHYLGIRQCNGVWENESSENSIKRCVS